MKTFAVGVLLSLFAVSTVAAPGALPSDVEVKKILADRIDAQGEGVGIVVGLIDPDGRRIVAHGTLDRDDRTVDGDTLFEIGSATKAFTALLLADAVARGEVALGDPVAKLLPSGVTVPERGGKKIALVDLATHTSALPRLPSNLAPADASNPYADYGEKQLYEFLGGHELTRDIGIRYEYSNLAPGLLGFALALRAGTDYETLVRTRITGPLGMKSTTIALGDDLRARLAPGHDREGKRAANWDFDALAGAGALRSTANDLLTFLAANLGLVESPLAPAMASMVKTRRPSGTPGLEIALGWHVFVRDGREIVWHNGGTGGYRSFVGFDPKSRAGVVVLSNMFTAAGVDDIGRHLLDSAIPLAQPPKKRSEIAVDPALLERYAGEYELAPGFLLTVTREGGRLFAQVTGQPKAEIFAESLKEFFYKVVDAQITFEAGESGPATGLVLHQGGRDIPAKRVGDAAPPVERKKVAVDPATLDRYTGRYQLAPGFVLTVTRDAERLFVQATGQPKLEVFAESPKEFYYEVVDAQITFEAGETGPALGLVLHQGGRDMPAKRIE
jgi:CubicO group peptidase (beta-lactamase class C family)